MTKDSIDYQEPQTLNLYTYAFNNPVSYRDPSGHWGFLDNYSEGDSDEDESDSDVSIGEILENIVTPIIEGVVDALTIAGTGGVGAGVVIEKMQQRLQLKKRLNEFST